MGDTAKHDRSGSRTQPMLGAEFERMFEMQRPALNAMAELNRSLYDSIVAANKEWGSFVNRRLKEDFAVPEHLAACTSVEDMLRVYTNYFKNAYSDYQSEFEEMTKLNRSIARDTITAMERVAQNKP